MEAEQSSSPPPPSAGDDCLVFKVNGERFEVPAIDPSTTLLEFLRSKTRFKSVKLGCGEDSNFVMFFECEVLDMAADVDDMQNLLIDCMLTFEALYFSYSLYILKLDIFSINGCSVTTSEGLGNSKDGFHPIHQRFAGFHASQCGFCTPGMCMSLFSALANAEKTNQPQASPGFSKLTVSEAEKAIAGNLCRCTGYRPIADACKSFAADVDMEDLGINSFWNKGDKKEVHPRAFNVQKNNSGFIRNSASLGGNLVMAQRKYFPSDIVTLLLAVGSSVSILTGHKHETITMEEFLSRPPLEPKDVLLSVHFHEPTRIDGSVHTNSKLFFDTYRAAPRPLGNALPYLNAAFLADISCDRNGSLVNNIRLAFGAYGTKHATRARKVEEYLTGKILSLRVLDEAIKLVKGAVVSEEGTSYAAYRSSLAVGFLFEFLNSFSLLCCSSEELSGSVLEGTAKSINDKISQTGRPPLLSSAKQVIQSSRDYYPVGEPMPKFGAAIQASGEAMYVDDIPSPPNCLHGAFICSTRPVARVKSISFKSNQPTDVISVKDIPREGENIGCMAMFGSEPLFADDLTRFAGDLIGFVVAESQKNANLAAKTALVEYDTEGLDPPILTVEEAVERSSFFDVPPYLYPQQVGDFSKGMAEADHKILSAKIKLGSQYYFYMETQTALAIPDEDNCMVVYSSIQCPEFAHRVIARCLGVPDHNVRVLTRRVGGGFGGKALKQCRVGFKSNGKITALHLDILINAGVTADISPIMPSNMIGALKKYNWGALSFDIKVCKTNHSSKSAMRAPGEVQGSFIPEAIIEHVASVLSMEVDSVRNRNLHTYESLKLFYGSASGESIEFTLPSIWDKVGQSSSFDERIAMPLGKVSVLWDGSIVVEVGGIELGQGLWTKVKQVTAYALSSIQCDGIEDLVEKVRVVQTDTLSLVQGGFTAGSTTSESSCEAVRLCCNILVERLAPLKEKLQEEMGSVKWDVLILQFHVTEVKSVFTKKDIRPRNIITENIETEVCSWSIFFVGREHHISTVCSMFLFEQLEMFESTLQKHNLAAHSFFVPDSSSTKYLNYGAAVSEVEVNILSGETRILRTDIVYDCGQSMNPAVDLGQIEGAFVQGLGFFMLEEYQTNSDGLVIADGTWTYKIPTIDTIPKQFNVEVLNSGHHQKRVLSSKASVHCATRAAIKEARKQLKSWGAWDATDPTFQLDVPATMPVVKQLCGLNTVETYLQSLLSKS
ncbi:UNVERIFIED_CONTAM: Abscisic-aldehyde oxidase [Sesamum radiatum]|uniref:Abscisic-aldehyde oxidase n=1 Tax=Sesamum radiatum TaxID=300843 RepID=A0AAW2UTX3_SESRA